MLRRHAINPFTDTKSSIAYRIYFSHAYCLTRNKKKQTLVYLSNNVLHLICNSPDCSFKSSCNLFFSSFFITIPFTLSFALYFIVIKCIYLQCGSTLPNQKHNFCAQKIKKIKKTFVNILTKSES